MMMIMMTAAHGEKEWTCARPMEWTTGKDGAASICEMQVTPDSVPVGGLDDGWWEHSTQYCASIVSTILHTTTGTGETWTFFSHSALLRSFALPAPSFSLISFHDEPRHGP